MIRNRTFFILSVLFLLILPITILVLQDRQTISQHAATIDPSSGNPAPNGPIGAWHLAFSDEFNGTSLDLTKWIMCNPSFASSCVPYNGEKELYNTALTNNKNVQVSGGQLHLIALKDGSGDHPYSSGMVSTGPNKWNYNQPGYQSFQFTYGYYEGRVKIPKGNGFWPSLWMLPDQDKYGCWAKSGEYDNFEIPGNNPTEYHFTAHWNANGTCGDPHDMTPQQATIADASTGFHTYGFDWEPDGLTWYVDGKQMGNKVTDAAAIKNTPFYIIANFSVGGTWPPLNGGTDASTPFPASMDIDYLWVWQKGAATGQPTIAVSPSPTVPIAVTPTLYCLGENSSDFCSSASPTLAEGVSPTGVDGTTPGEENPTTQPGDTTNPTSTPCPTDITASTVSVQHHRHNGHGGAIRGFFQELLQLLINLLNKLIALLGGNGGITLPGTEPCTTPIPSEQVTPTDEVSVPASETISPTTISGVTPEANNN